MTGPGLETLVPPHARVVIDASVLVAYLTGTELVSEAATMILDGWLATGRNEGVISSLSVGEALVRPQRAGRAREVGLGMLDVAGLTMRSVDLLVAAEAARVRAATSLRMPDSVVLATGALTSAATLVTNDQRLAAAVPQAAPEMQIVLLSDLV